MTAKTFAIAALLAATSFASVAEAGGGIRLGFGGPLPSFTATPARGGGSYGGGYQRHAKKRAPVVVARRSAPAPVARRAVTKSVTEPETQTQTQTQAETTQETTEPVSTGTTALIGAQQPVATAGTATDAPPAAEDGDGAKTTVTASEGVVEEEKAETGVDDCKKFVPALGLTISVGCEKK